MFLLQFILHSYFEFKNYKFLFTSFIESMVFVEVVMSDSNVRLIIF